MGWRMGSPGGPGEWEARRPTTTGLGGRDERDADGKITVSNLMPENDAVF
jgi:hypothetical protein